MKRILKETVFILALSFCISLIYAAASESGKALLKKAFGTSSSAVPWAEKPEDSGTPQNTRR